MLFPVPADGVSLDNRLRALLENAFLVLGVRPDAPADEVERQGEKLLAALAVGLTNARHYRTPLGPRERTPEQVRAALAALRDPGSRLHHEWWAAGWPT